MKDRKYLVVQRTGFVPYFLCAWHDRPHGTDGEERWDYQRDRALAFRGPVARQIANQLNAQRPAAPLPVVIEEVLR